MPRRGVSLFDELPEEVKPSERLAPGQPGRAWRPWGAGGWVVDCKDGSRVAVSTDTGRVSVLRPPDPEKVKP